MPLWEVYVKGMGCDYSGSDEALAKKIFLDYVRISLNQMGRANSQEVSLVKDYKVIMCCKEKK